MSSFWNPTNIPTSSSHHHHKRRWRNKGKQREQDTIPLFGSSTPAPHRQRSSSSRSDDIVLVRRKGSPPWWWLLCTKGTMGITVMRAVRDEHGARRPRGQLVLEPLFEGKVASFFPTKLVDVKE
ncbi:hypothetical protein M747DRAFT_7387 [Aspergillus niger ATCC 13496]|uniref:Uncharacterized protein n=1 Tax=Aspergillus niger ATCC 13496 TaxID=1353008 RepID=A0A370CHK6_ASPNG|nr:hypothetical protein M747DRAFT_7387 [Aspergillus niger ATCC 13496]